MAGASSARLVGLLSHRHALLPRAPWRSSSAAKSRSVTQADRRDNQDQSSDRDDFLVSLSLLSPCSSIRRLSPSPTLRTSRKPRRSSGLTRWTAAPSTCKFLTSSKTLTTFHHKTFIDVGIERRWARRVGRGAQRSTHQSPHSARIPPSIVVHTAVQRYRDFN